MRNTLKALRYGALVSILVRLASPAVALEQDNILFVGEQRSYTGNYGVDDSSISVVIDGLPYRGHFSSKSNEAGNESADSARLSGDWGRAFLFASSAKVMQCKLDAGFLKVSGRCHDAEGRPFELVPASRL